MVWLLAYCKIYEMFEEMCKEYVGIDRNDRLFNDLMAGFNHKILQTDREMFYLGTKARRVGSSRSSRTRRTTKNCSRGWKGPKPAVPGLPTSAHS